VPSIKNPNKTQQHSQGMPKEKKEMANGWNILKNTLWAVKANE